MSTEATAVLSQNVKRLSDILDSTPQIMILIVKSEHTENIEITTV